MDFNQTLSTLMARQAFLERGVKDQYKKIGELLDEKEYREEIVNNAVTELDELDRAIKVLAE